MEHGEADHVGRRARTAVHRQRQRRKRSTAADRQIPAGGWYALDFEFSTELKFREWPVGAPFVELPFRREELWEPTAVRRHVTWRFQAPETLADGADFLRCGQKDHTGSVRMRNFVLRPVTPLAATVGGDTPLRRHEAIFGNTFYANEDVATVGRRTEFTAENPLVLRYALPGRKFTGAKLHYNGRTPGSNSPATA